MSDDEKRIYRSAAWFGKHDKDGFIHRSWMRNQGLPADVFDGRPVVGICNTWSELTPCNAHLRDFAEHVKRGVWESGGLPVEFPVMSTGESNMRPTAMLYRNLVSMDVEESIRANPIDGVVLLCGCDKTTPSLVMGAASVDLPAIALSGGAMLNGMYKGQPLRHRYVPDLICWDKIVVELKAVSELISAHEAQLFNYMRIAHKQIGYLINFGHRGELQWKRFILSDLHEKGTANADSH
jgi:dihydroxyacid dehydratase/phosphogluconate dehydratase